MNHTSRAVGLFVVSALLSTHLSQPLAAAPRAATDPDTKESAVPPGTDSAFRVGPGDKLRIEVYKDPQLSQSLQVRPDGKITLPLIGDIDAAGRTPMELKSTIVSALREYITNPVVTVIVVEATASAYVMGGVNHPGAVPLQTGKVTVLQALALAGGLKDFADSKNIRVLRPGALGMTKTITFNYKEAIRGGAPVYLAPGDTVVVPD